MMPGADFKACLDTPHLVQDTAAANLVQQDLAQAQELLSAALGSTAVDTTEISHLCYRAMYSAAKALVHREGYRVSNFRCLLAALNELFVKTEKTEKGLVDQFVASQQLLGDTLEHKKAAEAWVTHAAKIEILRSRSVKMNNCVLLT